MNPFVAGFLVLLLNSAYLAASAAPSIWYFANVVLHPILGVALAVAVLLRRHPMARVYARAIGLEARGGGAPRTLKEADPLLAVSL